MVHYPHERFHQTRNVRATEDEIASQGKIQEDLTFVLISYEIYETSLHKFRMT